MGKKQQLVFIIFNVLVVVGILLMYRLSVPDIALKPDIDFLRTKTSVYHIAHWRWSFYLHVFTSTFVLIAGLLQFNSFILSRFRKLHRASGYVYITIVLLLSGPTGLVMGCYANGGLPARISFVLLACLWLFTTAMALKRALDRKFTQHGAWMARSYALALSALTLRAYALVIGVLNLELRPATTYIIIAWLSWTVNLIVAEVWIRKGGIQRLMTSYFPR